jgi:hypothetical protein
MSPAGTDVVGPVSQRTKHEGSYRKSPLVGSCGQHATVRVPAGQGHCEAPGPWAAAGAARTSAPEMCVSARSGCAAYEGFRTRALQSKYWPGARVGRSKARAGMRGKLRRLAEHYKRLQVTAG